MSDPRHATIKTRQLASGAVISWREYRFDNRVVPAFTTYKNNIRQWALENWLIERAIDRAIGLSTRDLRMLHKSHDPDEKGRRLKSPAVKTVKTALELDTPEADMGTAVHTALEVWFNTGRVPPGPEGSEAFIAQAIDFAMTLNPRPIYMEAEVYNGTLGYGGSADWIMEIDGALCLGDTKTGGVWNEAAMQLAAYAHAERLYPRTSEVPCIGECSCEYIDAPNFDRLVVLDLKPDSWRLLEVPPLLVDQAWGVFQAAVAIHKFNKITSRELFPVIAASAEKEAAA